VLYALFAAPQLEGKSLMVYFAVVYILWGVTYTMMDIPYWSIIPAVTENPKDRESLSVVGRTCAGVGNALITVFTVIAVAMLGSGNERAGFKRFALIVSVLFVVFELILFLVMKEQAQDKDQMKTTSVGEMFRALFRNDQAVITVITIILINSALYITSNLIIYFFKYDLGPTVESWQASYTTFSTVGGGSQILSMMAVYPALRRFMGNMDIFKLCLKMSITGYALLLAVCFTPFSHNIIVLCAIGLLIFMANGMLTVLTTVFLSNSVDYGELKTGHREESVIFSMQTFVVKAASGVAVFLTGIGLDLIGLKGNSDTTGEIVVQSASTLNGLHLLMTIIPILGLIAAMIVFTRKFILTDEKAEEIAARLRGKEIPL